MGVTELDNQGLLDITAGCGGICVGIVAGIIISALDHWSDIKKGVADAIADSQ